MELKNILVAQLQGGIFHAEDIIFQTDIATYAKQVTDILKSLYEEGKLKQRYRVSLFREDSVNVIKLVKIKEEKIEVDIRKDGVIYQIGAVIKQGQLFSRNSHIYEIASIIKSITNQRRSVDSSAMGIKTHFAIPYTEEVAMSEIDNIFHLKSLKELKFGKNNTLKKIEIGSRVTVDDIVIDTEIRSTDDNKAMAISFDFKDLDDKTLNYGNFINRVKPLYNEICKTFVAKTIIKPEINVGLLTRNESD